MLANDIEVEGTKAICEMLKINTTLTVLDLGGDEEIEKKKKRKKG